MLRKIKSQRVNNLKIVLLWQKRIRLFKKAKKTTIFSLGKIEEGGKVTLILKNQMRRRKGTQ